MTDKFIPTLKNQIKFLVIDGKRWFDKVNGNTYHSVNVVLNGIQRYIPMTYGYDSCYIQTAIESLVNDGIFKDFSDWIDWRNENHDKFYITVSDVKRKGDL